MKKLNVLAASAFFMLVWLAMPSTVPAQKNPKFDYPTLERQLTQEYHGESVILGSELAKLIAANQDFEMLRSDELSDKRGLPLWLRDWRRKPHPETEYSAEGPTKC